MKLISLLHNNKLNEAGQTTTRFVWGEMGRAANSITNYQKEHDTRMNAIKAAMTKHYPDIPEKNVNVYIASTPQEVTQINAAAKKVGQLGIWADKTTFIFV